MGVLGLWQILESVGHPIKIEGLEGKRLAVDANIWLYKFVRGFREKDNGISLDSHKLGLFNRILKLLFYKIKPVFVFDGPAPVLKRRTLERRQNVRTKNLTKVQDAAMKLLAEQIKKNYPDADVDHIAVQLPEFTSNRLVAAEKLTVEDLDLFQIPTEIVGLNSDDSDSEDSDIVEVKPDFKRIKSDVNAQFDHVSSVDIHSKDFENLPPEVRYEILHDIKESKRRIRNCEALPEEASSFSDFQLQRLKARRTIQEKIEKCEKDICSTYTGELGDGQSIKSFRVQSDASSTMILRQNVPSASQKIETKQQVTTDNPEEFQPSKQSIELQSVKPAESDDKLKQIIEKAKEMVPQLDIPDIYQTGEAGAQCASLKEVKLPESTFIHLPFTNEKRMTEELDLSPKLSETVDLSSTDSDSGDSEIVEITHGPKKVKSNENAQTINQTINIDSTDSESSTDDDWSEIHHNNEEPKSPIRICDVSPEQPLTSNLEYQPQPPEQRPSIREEPEKDTHSNSTDEPSNGQTTELSRAQSDAISSTIPRQDNPSTSQAIGAQNTERNIHSIRSLTEPQHSRSIESSTRNTNKITTKIIEEAKELLRLFGVPYIDAAGEAEAQCALLEELQLTEGTITDDSDVWLFGAKNVFRYFFNDDKYVMQYKMSDIEFHVRMTRENLVCLAMLVGSDYTDGIMNVGPVTALEILSEFPGENLEPLIKFKHWRDTYSKDKSNKKRDKFLRFKLPQEFPSRAVFDGYMKPMVDVSTEKFTWGTPELDELREYARRNFGWDIKKIDEKLLPVMKKVNERKTQTTIDSFFFKTAANQNPELFRSKRVNEALNKIAKTSKH